MKPTTTAPRQGRPRNTSNGATEKVTLELILKLPRSLLMKKTHLQSRYLRLTSSVSAPGLVTVSGSLQIYIPSLGHFLQCDVRSGSGHMRLTGDSTVTILAHVLTLE